MTRSGARKHQDALTDQNCFGCPSGTCTILSGGFNRRGLIIQHFLIIPVSLIFQIQETNFKMWYFGSDATSSHHIVTQRPAYNKV